MKAVLWDMDGTLVDTEPLWGMATYEMGEAMGKPLTDAVRESTVGGTSENTVRTCARWAELELTDEQVKRWQGRLIDRVARLLSTDLKFLPGVQRLLKELRATKIPAAVVTNTQRDLTDVSMKSIGTKWFQFSLCGDEVSQGKPAPIIYRTAASCLGLKPDDCLVLEDSLTGMTAARDAGCRVIGVPTGGIGPIADGVQTLSKLTASDANPEGNRNLEGISVADLQRYFRKLGAK